MNTKLGPSGSESLSYVWEYPALSYGTLKYAPLLAGDRLVCVTASNIFSLDVYTGEVVGEPYGRSPTFSEAPPAHSRGTLFFVDGDADADKLVALRLSDGRPPERIVDGKRQPAWKAPAVSNVVSVNASDAVVAVVYRDDEWTCVEGYDPLSGTRVWGPVRASKETPSDVCATRDALVFVADGHLFAVNIRSGDTRFNFSPAVTPADQFSAESEPQAGEVGDAAVVVAAGEAAVYGVDLRTGKQLWASGRAPAGAQWLTPAVADSYNLVAVANRDDRNGRIRVLELTTGAPRWPEQQQVADLTRVQAVGDKLHVFAEGGARLHVYGLASGKKEYEVAVEDVGTLGVVTGHGILFTPGEEFIRATPFGEQNAALFDGRTSRVTVAAEASRFDFREGDFTAEAWVSTTRGGELFSGYPTEAGDASHGFRANVSEDGRVRFAVFDEKFSNSFVASSVATNVADGSWHHVAVVRRGEGVEMYIDGVSVKVNSERKGPGALDISGHNALTFGAFAPGAGRPTESHLRGLMREVRLWDVALDAPKLQSRMGRELVGTEPHLLGYWPLDESDLTNPTNRVPHRAAARGEYLSAFATDLALDDSAFPYLLEQAELQWPYAGHWSARGAQPVSTRPALDAASGVIAFGTGNALYGVHAPDGMRAWGKAAHAGTSAPVAASGRFYAVTGADGLVSVKAATGETSVVGEFAGLVEKQPPAGTRLPAPATDGRWLAAASHDGKVWVLDTEKPDAPAPAPTVWKFTAPEGAAGDLALAGGRAYFVAGRRTLYHLDPAARKWQSFGVASDVFVVHGDSVFCERAAGEVVALSSVDLPKQRASFKVPDGSGVTGLVADADANLLVVATRGGHLYGLTFSTLAARWTARVPRGKAAAAGEALNAPTLEGRTVYCTSASGAVAAFDKSTGGPRGLFFEPTEITTPPLVDAGTVYFGCADAPPEAQTRDGALHSVVFGHTHVLRLGLDGAGAPEAQKGYAEVTAGDAPALENVEQCCVEAWVNTREGGEVLSLRPSAATGYGLRLWLEKDGAINFTCADLPEHATRWQQIKARAVAARACDGRWHHVAVSREGREKLTVYLDGLAVVSSTTVEDVTTPAPAEGLKVFIGADATAASPANFFSGLVGEIRLWDTYLTATRISERMHEKLVGNEPDLLAYWNFDAQSVHDGSRNGHDGRLVTGGGSSGYWLADLNFTHPSYPYLESAGRLVQEGEEGGSGPLADTIYELIVMARRADGGALASHPVTLWYVRHDGEGGPDTVGVSAPGAADPKLPAVRPDHGDEHSVTAKTDSRGKVVFKITTVQRGHGPSLDLRAGFLPANERYHVSVLIDSQKLDRPAPPHLEAQAKLIQDYHWETGDSVNHERDRSTWRAVITARNSDGTPRPGERLGLWAQEHAEVEVGGRRYPVNPQNGQSFVTDRKGELTVTLAASDVGAPALSVWAGFMHRDERYTVPLDQEAHGTLSKVTGDDLAQPRMVNWRPKKEYDPGRDDKAVLKKGYEQHKEKVATAINHVMTATQEPPPTPHAGPRRATARASARNFSDMRQPPPSPRTDAVRTLRTLRHIDRRAPVDADSFRQSLGRVKGFENSIGFVLEKKGAGPEGLELKALRDVPHVLDLFPALAAPARPTPSPELLGNIFEDAWDAVVDAAEAAWEAAKKIAVFIADQVTLVVEYADKVVQTVVSSVKEAVAAVAHIIQMIESLVEDVIRLLRLLFDWEGIIDCHRILKEISQHQMRDVRALTDKGKDEFRKMLAGLFGKRPDPGDLSKHTAGAASANTTLANDEHPQVRGQINSVHGKYVNSKADEGRDQTTLKADVRPVDPPQEPTDGAEAKALASALGGALQNPLGGSFGETYEAVKDLISGDFEKTFTRMWDAAFKEFDKVGQTLDAVNAMLNAEINIPFVSQLYKWITGGDSLTLLDVSCLAMAIPTHVGYGVFTLIGKEHEVRRFVDDYRSAGGVESLRLRGASLPGAPGDFARTPRNRALHWSYFVFYELYTAYSTALKIMQVSEGGENWKKYFEAKLLGAYIGVTGLTCKSLIYAAGMTGEEDWDSLDKVWQSALYAIGVGLDIYTCYDATLAGPSGAPGTESLPDIKDLKEFKDPLKVAASVGGAVLLGMKIEAWVSGRSKEGDLYQTRDVLSAIGLMLTFDDTRYFVTAVGPEYAGIVILWEGLAKGAAGCAHIAGVVKE